MSQAKSTVTFSTDFVTFSTSDFVTFAVRVLLLALAVIFSTKAFTDTFYDGVTYSVVTHGEAK